MVASNESMTSIYPVIMLRYRYDYRIWSSWVSQKFVTYLFLISK
jgi:hypothetical protein